MALRLPAAQTMASARPATRRALVCRAQLQPQSIAAGAAAALCSASLILAPAALAKLPAGIKTPTFNEEAAEFAALESIIAARSGKVEALPELTAAPEGPADVKTTYAPNRKPLSAGKEQLVAPAVKRMEAVKEEPVEAPKPAREVVEAAPVVVDAPKPAPVVVEAPKPAPAVVEAPKPAPAVVEAPKPAPAVVEAPKPAPAVVEAPAPVSTGLTTRAAVPAPSVAATQPAAAEAPATDNKTILAGVAFLALGGVVGALSGNKQEEAAPAAPAATAPAPEAPAAPEAAPAPAGGEAPSNPSSPME